MTENLPLYALAIGLVGLVATMVSFFAVKKRPAGAGIMHDLAEQISLGAMAFLKR